MNVRVGMTAFEGRRRKPLEAARAFCVACQGGLYEAVAGCSLTACPLRPHRGGEPTDRREAIIQAIRAYCVGHCLPDQPDEMSSCQAFSRSCPNGPCPLWPFRLGDDPYDPMRGATEASRERQLTLLPLNPEPTPTKG